MTRYILAEFTKSFLVTLTALTVFMLLVGVVRQAYEESLGFQQILALIPFIVPDALRFTVPGTVLFATCNVYGRMSSFNEFIAMKALGLSPMSVIWPVVSLTFLISLGTVWLNDIAVSWGYHGMRRVVLDSLDEIAYRKLKVHRSYTTFQFSINVKGVENRRLIQPTISFLRDGDSPLGTIQAEEAEISVNPVDRTLRITCYDAVVEFADEAVARLPVISREISLEQASSKSNSSSPSWMAFHQLGSKAAEVEKELIEKEAALIADHAFDLLSVHATEVGSPSKVVRENTLRELRWWMYRLQTEQPRRWANGLSCLCFMWVGAPMAIRLRNSDVLKSFFLCFLPILGVYYPLLMAGVDQAKRGAFPPWCVWSGNVMLLLWGLYMLRHVRRY